MPFMPRRSRRSAAVASVAALALGLPLLGTTVLAGPAQSADPVADCIPAYPVASLVAGQQVEGLTVVQGTTPTTFTGEVLGVLEDGIGPDLDMIMVDVDMPAVANAGGIWQGMSGSPVYVEVNGEQRLLGAVAYGLATGPSPIAGITPYEDMDGYLGTPPPARVALGGAAARTVAARAGITTRQAQQGFRELPMPLGVSGVSTRRLAQLHDRGPKFLEKNTYVMGRAASVGAETIVAGGNMAVSVAYGDVSMAGVGTATSVCGGRVVGFGHPMALLGSTTEALHPADAVYVQPESLGSPFKVANLGPVVGTVTDDRMTGITGSFGAGPKATTVSSTLTYGARSRTGATAVSVADFLGDATLYQLSGNHDRVVDGPATGSELQTWTITGTDNGTPFTLTQTDRYTGPQLGLVLAMNLGELAYTLSAMEGVSVDAITVNGTLTDGMKRHKVAAVQQRRGGTWVAVTKKAPATAKAGGSLRLRVVLAGTAGPRTVDLAPIKLPKKAAGRLVLAVQGGDALFGTYGGETVAQVRAALAQQQRHDTVRVQVGTPDRVNLGASGDDELDVLLGMLLRGKATKPARFVRSQTAGPLDHVVSGRRMLRVVVTR